MKNDFNKNIKKNKYDETIEFEYKVICRITNKSIRDGFAGKSQNAGWLDNIIIKVPNVGEKNKNNYIDLPEGSKVEIIIKLVKK